MKTWSSPCFSALPLSRNLPFNVCPGPVKFPFPLPKRHLSKLTGDLTSEETCLGWQLVLQHELYRIAFSRCFKRAFSVAIDLVFMMKVLHLSILGILY